MSTHATGLIRVIKAPEGEPPDEVRQAWVGLELPCLPEMGVVKEGKKVVSLEPVPDVYGVLVPYDLALSILAEANPKAARWFRENCFLGESDEEHFFIFVDGDVTIIKGVTRLPITYLTEEMMGDPGR